MNSREWKPEQTYQANSIVNKDGQIYVSRGNRIWNVKQFLWLVLKVLVFIASVAAIILSYQ